MNKSVFILVILFLFLNACKKQEDPNKIRGELGQEKILYRYQKVLDSKPVSSDIVQLKLYDSKYKEEYYAFCSNIENPVTYRIIHERLTPETSIQAILFLGQNELGYRIKKIMKVMSADGSTETDVSDYYDSAGSSAPVQKSHNDVPEKQSETQEDNSSDNNNYEYYNYE